MSREISNADDIIDSRDVIERLEELGDLTDDELKERYALEALEAEASSADDWRYGEALIRDSHFEDYARELASDIGAISGDESWPLGYIDWERAADALKMDYTAVDFDGVTYWIR